MEKGLHYSEAVASLLKRQTLERADAGLRSLALLDRSRRVRRLMDLAIRDLRVEPIPVYLSEGNGAILVSNYPSVSQSLRAVIKVGCRLSVERPRIKAIARPEIVTEANPLLKALGIGQFVFPVHKDQAGAYRLERRVVKEVLRYLDQPGNVMWMSITGRTRGNGLLEGDLRTGAVLFSLKKGIPLLPMGFVTKEHRGRSRVTEVRFGEPIHSPELSDLGDFERVDLMIDVSKLAMCEIARLLPPGQRADFEDADERLVDIKSRLGID
ncbi:MAG: hypothetical protein GTO63_20985 [Anaerolineae bacterium]|nr:hypothetical protein [Anaerolineae bacterium]NIN97274.1 hypothetical protein [Anaerolineae bacterium]NIQ80204.1 hypothetical protein [Anaerolineae bacterium]